GIAGRPKPGLGRGVPDHPAGLALGGLATADHHVVTRLNEPAVPPLLARADDGLCPGRGSTALVDLGVDVAGQRSGALYRPSIGLGLLSDDLGAHQDRLPESLPGDFGRHELESSADLLRALTLP